VIAVLVVMVDMNMLAAVHYFDNNMAPFSFAAVVSLSDGGGTVCVEGGALCYHITAQHVGRRSALSPPSPHPLPACLCLPATQCGAAEGWLHLTSPSEGGPPAG
jgi:hypothetical protein